MGKLGFTPLIGLAVVVALAMVAVFGAMSLTNPAFAAVGAPADAELAERTFNPQDAADIEVVAYVGDDAVEVDLIPHLNERQSAYVSHEVTGIDTGTADVSAESGFGAIGLLVTPGDTPTAADTPDAGTVVVLFNDGGSPILLDLEVELKAATGAMARDIGTPTVNVPVGANNLASDPFDLNVAQYFMDGFGTGSKISDIDGYTTTVTPIGSATAGGVVSNPYQDSDTANFGKTALNAAANTTEGHAYWLTITAEDTADQATDPTFRVLVVLGASDSSPTGGDGDGEDGSFVADSEDPGDGSLYTFNFTIDRPFNGGLYAMTIKMEGFNLPSNIGTDDVAMEVTDPSTRTDPNTPATMGEKKFTFNPATITVDGKELILTIPDVEPEANITKKTFSGLSKFKVLVYQSAGITNPTESNTYGGPKGTADEDREIFVSFGDSGVKSVYLSAIMVPRIVEIDPEDGGLGETVTATGKGFKDGTTLTVFLDRNRNGDLELGEDVLCVASKVGKDDIGSCEFEVTHPTFQGGPPENQMNYINAVDGRNGYVNKMDGDDYDLPMYELGASISATPKGGSPGEIILIQLLDFPKNSSVTDVRIANRSLISTAYSATTDRTGAVNFPITIPNWVKAGTQQLKVYAGGENGSQNIDLLGPQINVTPKSVLANQRVSLVGTGFSPGAVIANERDSLAGSVNPVVTIGGKVITGDRINDSDPVRVDNGGNWSASVDLPLAEATTAEGERALRITDSRGRTGVIVVDIPAREVSVTPENGRVGTIAVVRGTGFPSKNDEGSSFNVQIVYDASNGNTTTVSATPDASGRFETQLRIPTTAAIPSSNSIKVSFEDEVGVDVVTTVAHDVPEGIITLSETSGGPGSTVSVSGEGFKSFVPISLVKIGTLDVTPAPKPSTDGNGMMSFDVIIPGLDVGIQTIEVHVGRTTASTGFTVTESGINPGNIKAIGPALEDLGDNFVNVWHFNNDTKAWSFYDGMEGSDLTHLITGETYLIQIKSTMEVILNNDTRNLTCVNGNCWNQIVW